jgi:hypothetical protein
VSIYRTGDWKVSAYYADDVKPPKEPGALAIEVRCQSDSLKDLEVQVAEGREDIGWVSAVQVP